MKAGSLHTQLLTVYEHESLHSDRGEKRIGEKQLHALQSFYGEKGTPFYSLIHNGVKFNEHVGVIQIGQTLIEVLPKSDRYGDEARWRKVLIDMLRSVGAFDIYAPSSANLQIRPNTILDLYFELFVIEMEYLLHRGLVKKYRHTEGNRTALKGSIHFARHVRFNLVHQERFYVKYSTYDKKHDLHALLYKALRVVRNINTNSALISRIERLLLDFPEMYDIRPTETLFDRIVIDRKTTPYKSALEIARLILLNYHPDVRLGRDNVLALMFDMNALWERFVYVSLRKFRGKGCYDSITAQRVKNFWKPETGSTSSIKPDIVLNMGNENCIILDTKWKNLNGHNPSNEDIRQMFVYLKYFGAQKAALIYPGTKSEKKSGTYYNYHSSDSTSLSNKECGVISIEVGESIQKWQKDIYDCIAGCCRIDSVTLHIAVNATGDRFK